MSELDRWDELKKKLDKKEKIFNFTHKDKKQTVLLNQIKVLDIRRAMYQFGNMDKFEFKKLEEKIINLLKVTLKKRGAAL